MIMATKKNLQKMQRKANERADNERANKRAADLSAARFKHRFQAMMQEHYNATGEVPARHLQIEGSVND